MDERIRDAARRGELVELNRLLAKDGRRLNARDGDNATPLMLAAWDGLVVMYHVVLSYDIACFSSGPFLIVESSSAQANESDALRFSVCSFSPYHCYMHTHKMPGQPNKMAPGFRPDFAGLHFVSNTQTLHIRMHRQTVQIFTWIVVFYIHTPAAPSLRLNGYNHQ